MPIKQKSSEVKHETRPVKEIAEPAKTIPSKASVQDALDEMRAQQTDSSLVTNKSGKLLGEVSRKDMNRKVGGLGHDPKTVSVKEQVETNKADCFEDQTIAEAKQIMHDARISEVPVITGERLLLGKITSKQLHGIEKRNKGQRRTRRPTSAD